MHEKQRPGVASWRLAHRSIAETIRSAFQLARGTAVVRLLCLITIVTAFGVMPVHFLWPARLESLLDSHTFWLFGWIWALVNLTAVAGSALSARLHRSVAREAVLCASCVGRAAGIAVAALASDFAVVLCGLLFMELAFAVSHPAYQAWLNEHIAAELRATVLSVANMSFTIGGAMGLLTLGWVARSAGIPVAWTMCALVLVAVAPAFLVIGRIARPVSGIAAEPSN
jgi:MFS family permease